MSNYLFDESEKYTLHKHLTIPISPEVVNGKKIKKPPKGSGAWTDHKGSVYDKVYREKWFCNNKDVECLAVAMNSIKLCIAFDVDGIEGLNIFTTKIVRKLPSSLQDKINKTAHTKTRSGGYHWIVEISRNDFPLDIDSMDLWTSPYESHSEIKLFGTKKYLIERGPGYECIRDIDCLQLVTKDELTELLNVCEQFGEESKVISKVSSIVLRYWKPPIRDAFTMYFSGYLHKDSDVPKHLARELFEHIINGSPFGDENLEKTLDTIERTYNKNLHTEDIKGYSGLEDILSNEPGAFTALMSTVKRQFGNLGYSFNTVNNRGNDESDDDEEVNIVKQAVEFCLSKFYFVTVEEDDEIYYYKDGCYVKGGEVLIKKICEEQYEYDLSISIRREIRDHIMAKTYRPLADFDKDINIINMANGFYDIQSNVLIPHSHESLSLRQIPVVYDSKAQSKLFGKFLIEVLYKEEIATLVESMAYTFWKDNAFEYIIILYGEGSNGKSVVFGVLTALHGIDNVSNVSLKTILERPFGLFDLVGKNCNLDAELSTGIIEDTAILKKITGRQLVRVEQKNQRAFDARIHAKPWLSANKIRQSKDETAAWYRRNIIITFPIIFDVEPDEQKGIKKLDPQLIYKLTTQQELSGIFNILMNALRRVLKYQEIHQNERTIEQRRLKYESLVDPIPMFLEKVVDEESTESDFTTSTATYIAFERFCEVYRLIKMKKIQFGKSMRRHGIISDFARKEENKKQSTRIWRGIKLVAQYKKYVEDKLNLPGDQVTIDELEEV